ncbi:UDP-glucose--hexose-1-phosphate uridylyltransferase [Ornithinibacillus gellani]|uniref:UDP-glucose--hexose-1-phosphate uridylyltransferase n=1 Tax=Ornithinibacillus gellani TaxID=2293253 RepID=UPI0037C82CF0
MGSENVSIFQTIQGLVDQAVKVKLIEPSDQNYARNQVLAQLQLTSFPADITEPEQDTIPNLVEKIIAYAVAEGVIDDIFDEKEMLAANVMNCFVARPSTVNQLFWQHMKEDGPQAATDYFYELSKNSNYIQSNRIQKNIQFKAKTDYGALDITINLSKPEKDPEQIKREKEMKQPKIQYPSCVLCVENEGYVGRTGYPARANHRIVQVPLLGEHWYLQYSPYVYYNEHSILLAEEHRDMHIDRHALQRLLTFTELFPHYFIGSNADLPIVGGSILTHDHYQAGRYDFAMTKAASVFDFELAGFEQVSASILKWPLSVIRLQSDHLQSLVDAGDHILSVWRNYQDEAADIIAKTGDTPHNTITPIARRRGEKFELDVVLRNNRTTAEHPLGIFHPHADVHHIKRENIGLIEVMGLAVLPARLKEELAEIKQALLGQPADVAAYHLPWLEELKQHQPTSDTVDALIEKELGNKFARVLEDAGVFKQTDEGIAAFKRFIQQVNI